MFAVSYVRNVRDRAMLLDSTVIIFIEVACYMTSLVLTYFIATLHIHVCNGVGPQVLPTLVTALPLKCNISIIWSHDY